MTKPSENYLWFVAAVAFVLGVIGGIGWSDFERRDDWLFHYQTLITGILAIAAAVITVRAMTTMDERQQRRHEEMLSLSLRHDTLRIQRVSGVVTDIMVKVAENLRIKQPEFSSSTYVAKTPRILVEDLKGVDRQLNSPQMVDAKDLFDELTSITYDIVKIRVTRLGANLSAYDEFRRDTRGADLTGENSKIANQISETAECLVAFAEGLRRLGSLYNDPSKPPLHL